VFDWLASGSVIESNVPIVVQHTRLDSRQAKRLCFPRSPTPPETENASNECGHRTVGVLVFQIPTDLPESDGTLEWSDTTT